MSKKIKNFGSDYKFIVNWNIHMYNHELIYSDSVSSVKTIIEDAATNDIGILVWEMDFSDDENRRKLIVKRFIEWAELNFLKYRLIPNSKRSNSKLNVDKKEFRVTKETEIRKRTYDFHGKSEKEVVSDNLKNKTNFQLLPLTSNELKKVETEYQRRYSRFKNTSLIAPFIGIIALFTPPEIWNVIKYLDKRQGMRKLEDMNEYMFQSPNMIIIVILLITVIIFLNYHILVKPIKKDLEDKQKFRGYFKVSNIEHLSKKVSKNLDGLDTILHFEKNNSKIRKHLFKKIKTPELLNAKGIIIEQSKHSGIIFLESIIE